MLLFFSNNTKNLFKKGLYLQHLRLYRTQQQCFYIRETQPKSKGPSGIFHILYMLYVFMNWAYFMIRFHKYDG